MPRKADPPKSPDIDYDKDQLPSPSGENVPLREFMPSTSTSVHSRLGKSVSVPMQTHTTDPKPDVTVPGSSCGSSSKSRPTLLRMESIREGLISGGRFFGLSLGEDSAAQLERAKQDEDKWLGKRLRRLDRKYGLKADKALEAYQGRSVQDDLMDGYASASTPGTERSVDMRVSADPRGNYPYAASTPGAESLVRGSAGGSPEQSRSRPPMERKPSGMWIMKESLGSLLKRGVLANPNTQKPGFVSKKASFKPNQVDKQVPSTAASDISVDSDERSADSSQVRSIAPPSDSVRFSMDSSSDSAQVHLENFSSSGEIEPLQRPTMLPLTSKFTTIHPPDLPALDELSESFENIQESKCLPFDKSYKEEAMRAALGAQRPSLLKTKTPLSLKLSTPMSIASYDDEVFFDVTPTEDGDMPFPPIETLDRISEFPVEEEPTPDYSLDDDKVADTETLSQSSQSGVVRKGAEREPIISTDTAEASTSTVPGLAGRAQLDLGDSGTFARPLMTFLGPDPSRTTQDVGEPRRPKVIPGQHRRGLQRQDNIDHEPADKEKAPNIIMDGVQTTVLKSKQHIARRTRRGGEGAFGRFLNRRMKKHRELPDVIKKQIAVAKDDRPFFTWWITSAQILITLLSVILYGFGPFGYERIERRADVMHASFTNKMVGMYEPSNIWLGPSFADLIRLGAKYSPCMRQERNVIAQINEDRRLENLTGCCIYNDGGGCFQTGEQTCPKLIATLHKWGTDLPLWRGGRNVSLHFDPSYTGEVDVLTDAVLSGNGRKAGAVCGQDPFFCEVPASIEPHVWPDDLTKWPICHSERKSSALPPHMTCHRIGRPCCIHLQGRCRIATKEYCDFVEGTFHENATLCSQVNCLGDVCGMFPFFKKDHPDQFYRLFLSLFQHAGIIHCAISVVLQLWLMRDLEYLIGWKRMALIYIGSGVGGNLASAIFVPYHPEVGPAGSQLGIQAALLVDAYYHRALIENPWSAYREHLAVVFILFCVGLLPWIDNWSHIFGFLFGLLISLAVFPYMTMYDDKKDPIGFRNERITRMIIVIVSLISMVALFAVLLYVFFSNVQFTCYWCEQLNCLSFLSKDSHFCDNQGLSLHSLLPI